MTCLEKWKQTHPDEPGDIVEDSCPNLCGIPITDPDYCAGGNNRECERCWNREIPDTEPTTPVIKDSGERRQFDTGAVRDIQEGKGRCDLMPLDVVAYHTNDPILDWIAAFQTDVDEQCLWNALDLFQYEAFPMGMVDTKQRMANTLLETAKHFEDGAKKYGEYNWQKGIPVKSYIDSAVRHYLKWLRGDKDEPHDRAFCWNILCAIWTCKHKPELNDYAPKNDNTCVCCGAVIPEGRQVCHECESGVKNGI